MTDKTLLDMSEIEKNVYISLCYKNKYYPFNIADCKINDVSYSENRISVSCSEIQEYVDDLEFKIDQLKTSLIQLKEAYDQERMKKYEGNEAN